MLFKNYFYLFLVFIFATCFLRAEYISHCSHKSANAKVEKIYFSHKNLQINDQGLFVALREGQSFVKVKAVYSDAKGLYTLVYCPFELGCPNGHNWIVKYKVCDGPWICPYSYEREEYRE